MAEHAVMRLKEAARYLNMGPKALRRLAKARRVTYIRYGGGTSPFLFRLADLDSFLARQVAKAKEV